MKCSAGHNKAINPIKSEPSNQSTPVTSQQMKNPTVSSVRTATATCFFLQAKNGDSKKTLRDGKNFRESLKQISSGYFMISPDVRLMKCRFVFCSHNYTSF